MSLLLSKEEVDTFSDLASVLICFAVLCFYWKRGVGGGKNLEKMTVMLKKKGHQLLLKNI